MEAEAFQQFLRKNGRSKNAALRALDYTQQFDEYLSKHGRDIDDADPDDLESFVAAVEAAPGVSAKLHLWGLGYYYEFIDDLVMVHVCMTMRRERVEGTPFRLRQFRAINLEHTDRLGSQGIHTANDLLAAGGTASERSELSSRASVPLDAVAELVRLSDLTRIDGIKALRARLYLDAGVRSVADLAEWDPVELVTMLKQFVADTGFEGIAPLPGEARHAVETARKLKPLIKW
ncbi:MAG: DUF4332 domain-containing protein [Acidimicrobiia bacterium]|nr:DUF4332 domain-containing protein [Acidimicrobiia bacterium]